MRPVYIQENLTRSSHTSWSSAIWWHVICQHVICHGLGGCPERNMRAGTYNRLCPNFALCPPAVKVHCRGSAHLLFPQIQPYICTIEVWWPFLSPCEHFVIVFIWLCLVLHKCGIPSTWRDIKFAQYLYSFHPVILKQVFYYVICCHSSYWDMKTFCTSSIPLIQFFSLQNRSQI